MENEVIILKDKYSPRDTKYTPKGVVKAFDENGDILFIKENMIVGAGRKLIFDAITGSTSFNMNDLRMKVGSNGSVTTEGMSSLVSIITDLNGVKETGYPLKTSTSDNHNYTITFKETFTNGNCEIKELGLFNGNTMFSRLVFPSYYLKSNTSVTFEYTIYF